MLCGGNGRNNDCKCEHDAERYKYDTKGHRGLLRIIMQQAFRLCAVHGY
jgi:hypothetical protein